VDEIERTLSQYEGVLESLVLLREDVGGNRRLVAYVVTPQSRLSATELRTFLLQELPHYMVPSSYVVLDHFPLTLHGKIDRQALPWPDASDSDSSAGFVAPRSPTEVGLATIWSQVLGVQKVGVYDNFFELGGDSILSIQIVARATEMGLEITPRQVFQYQTIAALSRVVGSHSKSSPAQEPVVGSVPLTAIQRWFFAHNFEEPHHWNQAVLLEARRPVDISRLEAVVEALINHHDALRLRFIQTDTDWQQLSNEVHRRVTVSHIDLSCASDAERTAALRETASTMHASLSLSKGELIRVALFELGPDERSQILIIVHHLVTDGISLRILLEDLQTGYDQLESGSAIRFPLKTASFQRWSELLIEYAKSVELQNELRYWMSEPRAKIRPLPLDRASGQNTEGTARTVTQSLDSRDTEALLYEIPSVSRAQIQEVLLTALVQTICGWTGEHAVLIDVEGHGREEGLVGLDVSRTVGWFSTLFPVLLETAADVAPADALKMIKEQLRSVPNRGIGYGLLRYCSGEAEIEAKLTAIPQAEICFEYLGQFDQLFYPSAPFGLVGESPGALRTPRATRPHALQLTAAITKARLVAQWTYSENLHAHATVEALASDFAARLQALIADCRSMRVSPYTPSDFSLSGLDEKALSNILKKVAKGDRRDEPRQC